MYPLLPARLWILLIWAVLIAGSLYPRPLMPVDETRYAAVAWEMWLRNDFLVPYLNGQTYSDKPPLLFWLMQLSWTALGVNDWSLRVISPLFSLATLFLSGKVAGLLWPDRSRIAELTLMILLGLFVWIVYSTLTMFDMLLAFFTLLGICSVLQLAYGGFRFKQWLLFGLAIGGGVLSKGPVILLHLLPVALLAPWWRSAAGAADFLWLRWYGGLVFGIFVGAAIALCWAIPAGISGGEAYRNAIFLGQTSGRLVKSFAHELPWWWYLQILLLLLLPWLLLKPFWSGIAKLSLEDKGVRFCVAWAVPVLVIFSLVSGKRVHYLLPLVPAAALMLARAASEAAASNGWKRAHVGVAVVFAVLGLVLALLPWVNAHVPLRPEFSRVSPLWGGLLFVCGAILAWVSADDAQESVFYTCAASVAALLLISGGFFTMKAEHYDTSESARKIAGLMEGSSEFAYFGSKYHGQYHFSGRLTKPIIVIRGFDELLAWAKSHQNGYIIDVFRGQAPYPAELMSYHHPYKSLNIALISSKKLLETPGLESVLKPGS